MKGKYGTYLEFADQDNYDKAVEQEAWQGRKAGSTSPMDIFSVSKQEEEKAIKETIDEMMDTFDRILELYA